MARRVPVEVIVEAPVSPAAVRSIRAAVTVYDVGDKRSVKRLSGQRQDWQAEAWEYFEAVGEIQFGATLIGNLMSRLLLYVGWQPDPGRPPERIAPEALPEGLSAQVYAQAQVQLAQLNDGQGVPEMLRKIATCLSIPGEVYITGRTIPDTPTDGIGPVVREHVRWDAWSPSELDTRSTPPKLKASPSAPGEPLGPEDIFVRVHRPHPQWSDLAHSPMRGVLEESEELLLLRRSIRAAARSRLNAGLLLWPQSMGRPLRTTAGADETTQTGVIDELEKAFVTPISDESSASGVVPVIVDGPDEAIALVRHLTFERPIDATAIALRRELIVAIAAGVDLPAQILLGLGDSKYWNAQQIDRDAFRSHLEPLAVLIVMAVTVGIFRPLMVASSAGVSEDVAGRLVIWYDPAELVAEPDMGAAADGAHDRLVISDEAYRRYRGFTEADAPDPDEVTAREARRGTVPPAGDGTPGEAPSPGPQAGLVAAATEPLGIRLARIDQRLVSRLVAAADAAVRGAMKRVGASARAKARRDARLTASIDGVANELVAHVLGPAVTGALGANETQTLEDAVAELEPRYRAWVGQARRQARAAVVRAGTADVDEETLAAAYAVREDEATSRGWLVLAAGLLAVGAQRLYDPEPVPGPGEFDGSVTVPAGVARDAVAVAGGATVGEDGTLSAGLDGRPPYGLATGGLAAEQWADVGLGVAGWIWLYGDPGTRSYPFEPHEALDGVEFGSWTDPVLANPVDFPPTQYLYPGDHSGCSCEAAPRLESREPRVVDPVSPSSLIARGLTRAPADEAAHARSSTGRRRS